MDYVLFGVKRVSPRAGGGIDCMGLKSINIELMFSKNCLFEYCSKIASQQSPLTGWT